MIFFHRVTLDSIKKTIQNDIFPHIVDTSIVMSYLNVKSNAENAQ